MDKVSVSGSQPGSSASAPVAQPTEDSQTLPEQGLRVAPVGGVSVPVGDRQVSIQSNVIITPELLSKLPDIPKNIKPGSKKLLQKVFDKRLEVTTEYLSITRKIVKDDPAALRYLDEMSILIHLNQHGLEPATFKAEGYSREAFRAACLGLGKAIQEGSPCIRQNGKLDRHYALYCFRVAKDCGSAEAAYYLAKSLLFPQTPEQSPIMVNEALDTLWKLSNTSAPIPDVNDEFDEALHSLIHLMSPDNDQRVTRDTLVEQWMNSKPGIQCLVPMLYLHEAFGPYCSKTAIRLNEQLLHDFKSNNVRSLPHLLTCQYWLAISFLQHGDKSEGLSILKSIAKDSPMAVHALAEEYYHSSQWKEGYQLFSDVTENGSNIDLVKHYPDLAFFLIECCFNYADAAFGGDSTLLPDQNVWEALQSVNQIVIEQCHTACRALGFMEILPVEINELKQLIGRGKEHGAKKLPVGFLYRLNEHYFSVDPQMQVYQYAGQLMQKGSADEHLIETALKKEPVTTLYRLAVLTINTPSMDTPTILSKLVTHLDGNIEPLKPYRADAGWIRLIDLLMDTPLQPQTRALALDIAEQMLSVNNTKANSPERREPDANLVEIEGIPETYKTLYHYNPHATDSLGELFRLRREIADDTNPAIRGLWVVQSTRYIESLSEYQYEQDILNLVEYINQDIELIDIHSSNTHRELKTLCKQVIGTSELDEATLDFKQAVLDGELSHYRAPFSDSNTLFQTPEEQAFLTATTGESQLRALQACLITEGIDPITTTLSAIRLFDQARDTQPEQVTSLAKLCLKHLEAVENDIDVLRIQLQCRLIDAIYCYARKKGVARRSPNLCLEAETMLTSGAIENLEYTVEHFKNNPCRDQDFIRHQGILLKPAAERLKLIDSELKDRPEMAILHVKHLKNETLSEHDQKAIRQLSQSAASSPFLVIAAAYLLNNEAHDFITSLIKNKRHSQKNRINWFWMGCEFGLIKPTNKLKRQFFPKKSDTAYEKALSALFSTHTGKLPDAKKVQAFNKAFPMATRFILTQYIQNRRLDLYCDLYKVMPNIQEAPIFIQALLEWRHHLPLNRRISTLDALTQNASTLTKAQCRLVDYVLDSTEHCLMDLMRCYRYLFTPCPHPSPEKVFYQGIALGRGIGCPRDRGRSLTLLQEAVASSSPIPALMLDVLDSKGHFYADLVVGEDTHPLDLFVSKAQPFTREAAFEVLFDLGAEELTQVLNRLAVRAEVNSDLSNDIHSVMVMLNKAKSEWLKQYTPPHQRTLKPAGSGQPSTINYPASSGEVLRSVAAKASSHRAPTQANQPTVFISKPVASEHEEGPLLPSLLQSRPVLPKATPDTERNQLERLAWQAFEGGQYDVAMEGFREVRDSLIERSLLTTELELYIHHMRKLFQVNRDGLNLSNAAYNQYTKEEYIQLALAAARASHFGSESIGHASRFGKFPFHPLYYYRRAADCGSTEARIELLKTSLFPADNDEFPILLSEVISVLQAIPDYPEPKDECEQVLADMALLLSHPADADEQRHDIARRWYASSNDRIRCLSPALFLEPAFGQPKPETAREIINLLQEDDSPLRVDDDKQGLRFWQAIADLHSGYPEEAQAQLEELAQSHFPLAVQARLTDHMKQARWDEAYSLSYSMTSNLPMIEHQYPDLGRIMIECAIRHMRSLPGISDAEKASGVAAIIYNNSVFKNAHITQSHREGRATALWGSLVNRSHLETLSAQAGRLKMDHLAPVIDAVENCPHSSDPEWMVFKHYLTFIKTGQADDQIIAQAMGINPKTTLYRMITLDHCTSSMHCEQVLSEFVRAIGDNIDCLRPYLYDTELLRVGNTLMQKAQYTDDPQASTALGRTILSLANVPETEIELQALRHASSSGASDTPLSKLNLESCHVLDAQVKADILLKLGKEALQANQTDTLPQWIDAACLFITSSSLMLPEHWTVTLSGQVEHCLNALSPSDRKRGETQLMRALIRFRQAVPLHKCPDTNDVFERLYTKLAVRDLDTLIGLVRDVPRQKPYPFLVHQRARLATDNERVSIILDQLANRPSQAAMHIKSMKDQPIPPKEFAQIVSQSREPEAKPLLKLMMAYWRGKDCKPVIFKLLNDNGKSATDRINALAVAFELGLIARHLDAKDIDKTLANAQPAAVIDVLKILNSAYHGNLPSTKEAIQVTHTYPAATACLIKCYLLRQSPQRAYELVQSLPASGDLFGFEHTLLKWRHGFTDNTATRGVLLSRAASAMNTDAQCRFMEWVLEKNITRITSRSLCYRYLASPVIQDSAERQMYLGIAQYKGIGCDADPVQGKQTVLNALASDSPVPAFQMARLHYKGLVNATDFGDDHPVDVFVQKSWPLTDNVARYLVLNLGVSEIESMISHLTERAHTQHDRGSKLHSVIESLNQAVKVWNGKRGIGMLSDMTPEQASEASLTSQLTRLSHKGSLSCEEKSILVSGLDQLQTLQADRFPEFKDQTSARLIKYIINSAHGSGSALELTAKALELIVKLYDKLQSQPIRKKCFNQLEQTLITQDDQTSAHLIHLLVENMKHATNGLDFTSTEVSLAVKIYDHIKDQEIKENSLIPLAKLFEEELYLLNQAGEGSSTIVKQLFSLFPSPREVLPALLCREIATMAKQQWLSSDTSLTMNDNFELFMMLIEQGHAEAVQQYLKANPEAAYKPEDQGDSSPVDD